MIFRACSLAGLLALALTCLTGCASSPTSVNASGPVERLDLFLTSLAFDLDGKPGPDGFGARVYASSRRSAEGVALTVGRLEILIFDGVLRAEDLTAATPLRTWSYAAKELRPYSQKTSIGTGYRFGLAWGDRTPRQDRITVVARYVASDGPVITSAPGSIPVAIK